MSGYWQNPVIFLLNTAVTLYILALMLRFLLQLVRADAFNPMSQLIVRITDPVLAPLRRVLPGSRKIDAASLVMMAVLQFLYFQLVLLIIDQNVAVAYLLQATVADLLVLLLNLYTFTILIQVVLSWINPGLYNPAVAVLYAINAPVLGRAQQLIPPLGGMDFSPLVVLIVIQVLKMLIAPFGIGI